VSPLWIIPAAVGVGGLAVAIVLARQVAEEVAALGRELGRFSTAAADVEGLTAAVEALRASVARHARR
jgi:hypothetical protein